MMRCSVRRDQINSVDASAHTQSGSRTDLQTYIRTHTCEHVHSLSHIQYTCAHHQRAETAFTTDARAAMSAGKYTGDVTVGGIASTGGRDHVMPASRSVSCRDLIDAIDAHDVSFATALHSSGPVGKNRSACERTCDASDLTGHDCNAWKWRLSRVERQWMQCRMRGHVCETV